MDLSIIDKNELILLIYEISTKGMYQSFIYTYNYLINIKDITIDKELVFTNSFKNSDDRIYKYLIKNKDFLNIKAIQKHKRDIIENIFSKHIPEKYKLKRLKALSGIISLDNMLEDMLDHCITYYKNKPEITHNDAYYFVKTLFKYYYKTCTELFTTDVMNNLLDLLAYKSTDIDATIKQKEYI